MASGDKGLQGLYTEPRPIKHLHTAYAFLLQNPSSLLYENKNRDAFSEIIFRFLITEENRWNVGNILNCKRKERYVCALKLKNLVTEL